MIIDPVYTDRIFDIEVGQTIVYPAGSTQLTISLTNGQRVITGIQKLVQRYMILFLTTEESVHFNQEIGTNFVNALLQNGIKLYNQLFGLFAISNISVIKQLSLDTEGMPDDEILKSAELVDFDIDTANQRLRLNVKIISMAGDAVEFVLPTAIVRS
ncbi:hypothetical protein ACFLQL_00255 [Verrucomicrobiota bacterium]